MFPALLAVGDAVWNALIAGVVTLVLAWMTHRAAKKAATKVAEVKVDLATATTHTNEQLAKVKTVLTEATAQAAEHAEEVKVSLETTTTSTTNKLAEIHRLVNGNLSTQLKISAAALRRVAELDPNPATCTAATIAENALQDHLATHAQLTAIARDK